MLVDMTKFNDVTIFSVCSGGSMPSIQTDITQSARLIMVSPETNTRMNLHKLYDADVERLINEHLDAQERA